MQTNTPCGSTAQPGFFALQSKHSALHARARRAFSSAWTFLSTERAASFMASVLPSDCFRMYSRCTGRRCAMVYRGSAWVADPFLCERLVFDDGALSWRTTPESEFEDIFGGQRQPLKIAA